MLTSALSLRVIKHKPEHSVVPESDQTCLDTAFAKGDEKIVEKTKRKFEVVYFIAKEGTFFQKIRKDH